jgi:hypothetical protein
LLTNGDDDAAQCSRGPQVPSGSARFIGKKRKRDDEDCRDEQQDSEESESRTGAQKCSLSCERNGPRPQERPYGLQISSEAAWNVEGRQAAPLSTWAGFFTRPQLE